MQTDVRTDGQRGMAKLRKAFLQACFENAAEMSDPFVDFGPTV